MAEGSEPPADFMDNLMGRYRNVTILAAAIIVQVLGLAIQVRRPQDNQPSRLFRLWAVSAITPFERAIVGVQTGASNIWRGYFYLRGVRQENRELKQRIEQLQLEQVRLEQDASQAHRLQTLFNFKEQFILKTLAAQVIGSSGSGQSRTVYIDKGLRDGIQQEMAVISADGVVGRVITVYNNTAQVLLINDHDSGAGSIIERSRVLGITQGKATGEVVINKVMADEDVRPGDKVLTSGGDLIFPKGLFIGTVARIERGPEFLEISVKPAAALNRLEEVLVILKKEEREPASADLPRRASDILAERLPSVPDKPAKSDGSSAAKPPAANQAAGARAAQTEAQGKLHSTQNAIAAPPSASDAGRSPGAGSRNLKPATGSPVSTPARKPPDSTSSKPAPKSSSEPTPSTDTPQ